MHTSNLVQVILVTPFLLAFILYLTAVIVSNRNKKQWPIYRIVLWIVGILSATITVIGPLAQQMHTNFSAHMIGHLLLGMLAPLFIALAAPMTLILRTLPVPLARNITYVLRSWPLQILHHPITASILNVGGLWLLYTTELFHMMHQNMLLYVTIHFHVFLAGYLFTISIIYIDPSPNRKSYMFRSVIFFIALSGHAILSKYIYANPPVGVTKAEAELGGMIMYYGGDAIEVGLICILFYQWYKHSRFRGQTNLQSYEKGGFHIKHNPENYTVVGTDIEEVKRLNANSGMSYKELNEWFAKKVKSETTGITGQQSKNNGEV
ncbi:cytochrome c oxidase assembly protein [Psychrobacillus sp. FJAT-51614]|uniref:Cytochrome c oxidase assembly protein n=1 Tax=Psychrobacillus mangrovi TaxID=3117745 RepID=A0ABU8F8R8_9BACI